jgi:hypothetical protein
MHSLSSLTSIRLTSFEDVRHTFTTFTPPAPLPACPSSLQPYSTHLPLSSLSSSSSSSSSSLFSQNKQCYCFGAYLPRSGAEHGLVGFLCFSFMTSNSSVVELESLELLPNFEHRLPRTARALVTDLIVHLFHQNNNNARKRNPRRHRPRHESHRHVSHVMTSSSFPLMKYKSVLADAGFKSSGDCMIFSMPAAPLTLQ